MKTKKRSAFVSEKLEIIRRDNHGKKIFHSKGKPNDVLTYYVGKFEGFEKSLGGFGKAIDKRKKTFKELFKCKTKKKKLI